MTLAELTFIIERMAEAGCDADQLVALARAARDWQVEQKALRAVKRALAPVNTDKESYFPAAAARNADSGVPVSADSRKAVARKALLMTWRLKPCARRIGAALVERYNLETGRCDASVQKLADDAGYDLRSARRAIGELTRAGLFACAHQVGRGRTNAYTPMWEALGALAAETEVGKPDSENRTRAAKPDGRVRQNHMDISPPSADGGERRARAPVQQSFLLPLAGGAGAVAAERQKALAAVELALRGKYRAEAERRQMLAVFAGLDEPMQAIVADAEIAERGGLRAFEAWLRSHHGQGPPAATGTG